MNTENQNSNQVPINGNGVLSNNISNTGRVQQAVNPTYPSGSIDSKNVVPGANQGGVSLQPNSASLQQTTPAVVPTQQVVVSPTNRVGVAQNQGVQNGSTIQNANVVPNANASSTPAFLDSQKQVNVQIPPVPVSSVATNVTNEVLNEEKPIEKHEVVEILSSSFDQKNKVNLLTPEQKEALTKKREAAFKEKESYQPKPVSKFKRIMSIMVLIILFGIVFFLPDISNYLSEVRNPSKTVGNTPITTGTLKCSLDKLDNKYNFSYTYDFDFTNSKLNRLTYVQATMGDEFVDQDDLNQRLINCDNLKTMITGLSGVRVACSLSGGVLTEEQMINYDVLNHDQVTAAYAEAGGLFPEFTTDTNIDMIEKNMKAAGYTCERVK